MNGGMVMEMEQPSKLNSFVCATAIATDVNLWQIFSMITRMNGVQKNNSQNMKKWMDKKRYEWH